MAEMPQDMDRLKFPIGAWSYPESTSPAEWKTWIAVLAAAPQQMRAAVEGLTPDQLNTPYRPGGWTARQVVHHVPDSHMNGYIRFKLAVTEDTPTIKPYNEALWSELPEVFATPIETSLVLLDTLHGRWVGLLESMTEADFGRKFHHPEVGTLTLGQYLAGYAWHSRHHVAHITSLRQRMGW